MTAPKEARVPPTITISQDCCDDPKPIKNKRIIILEYENIY